MNPLTTTLVSSDFSISSLSFLQHQERQLPKDNNVSFVTIVIPKSNPGGDTSKNGIDSKALDLQKTPCTAPTRGTFECKLDSRMMEPTPFPEGTSLRPSQYTRNSYVLARESAIFFGLSASYPSCDDDYKGITDHDTISNITHQPNSKHEKLAEVLISSQPRNNKHAKKQINPPKRDPKIPMSKTTQEAKWEEFFLSLLLFKKQNGHCHVPHTYPQDPDLSRWAKRQRRQYNLLLDQKPSYISYERIQKLESIGFVWDPQWCVWDARRQELAQYLLEHGNCNVPSRYAKNPQLGMWVKRQRRQYKLFQSGKLPRLPPERFRILNDMGFEWDRLPKGNTKGNDVSYGRTESAI